MSTTTKSLIMQEAHRIAKNELEGDYIARLKIALKKAWANFKSKIIRREHMEYKGIKVICTADLDDLEYGREDMVYDAASDDRNEKIKIYNVSDKAIAKANNRVFIRSFMNGRAIFDGDTYNHKEEIKELAQKHNVRAKFTGARWEIEFQPDSEQEALKVLEDLQEYDMNSKTARDIDEMIKDLEG